MQTANPEVNFLLHPAGGYAEPPEFPHVQCCNGFAWHPKARKRKCVRGITAARAEVVASVFAGPPIERVLACRLLIAEHPGIMLVLFSQSPCIGCGDSHAAEKSKWIRAARSIHVGAIAALREANPSLYNLFEVDLPPSANRKPRTAKVGIPFREDPEQCKQAQIAWACELVAKRELRD